MTKKMKIIKNTSLFVFLLVGLFAAIKLVTLLLNFTFEGSVTDVNSNMQNLAADADLVQLNLQVKNFRTSLVSIIFFASLLTTSIFVVIFLYFKTSEHFLWVLSWTLSILFTLGVFLTLVIVTKYTSNHDLDSIVATKANLENFKKTETEKSRAAKIAQDPIYIRSGIYIQSLEFTTSNNVSFTGYIWQVYEFDKHDTTKIKPGFILPEEVTAEIEESYRKYYANEMVVGWKVNATVREIFDYSMYPFDYQNVWIRFWHTQFEQNIILVPDFDAYKNSKSLMGIEEDIVLNGWNIQQTLFGYCYNTYTSNFGMPDYIGQAEFPELYYCVLIQRDYLSTFISDMVPIAMVLIILFICVLVAYDESPDAFFSFNILELLSLMATIIFVIILAQLDLRGKIPSGNVLYIEYYYFVLYFVILAILIDYIALNKFKKNKIIQYGDNLLVKALFLPATLAFILWSTYLIFS